LVKVCWDARSLAMFAVDLSSRGIDITEQVEDTELPATECFRQRPNSRSGRDDRKLLRNPS
jgi:hypothetical protein